MSNLKTQGFILLDVDVAALNNAGKNTSSNYENAVATKKVFKNGNSYVYVSGQAWRFWWREALVRHFGWVMSPITREGKIAFTEANPREFPDDDIFGYMRAAKEEVKSEDGKTKKVDITVTRISPLKNSAIVSAAAVRPAENWSVMARQDDAPVPYSKEEYSAIMKGMFSLDIMQVGTFSNYNRTGFKNLSENRRKEILDNGGAEIADPFAKNGKGEPQKLVQLAKATRVKRATDTLQALKFLSGGAMQTNNMADVTPKFIILASTTSGNHPFSHIVSSQGKRDDSVDLNFDGLLEVLKDYKEQFVGTVFVGLRTGFWDEHAAKLQTLKDLDKKDYPTVSMLPVNEAVDAYCKQLETQIP